MAIEEGKVAIREARIALIPCKGSSKNKNQEEKERKRERQIWKKLILCILLLRAFHDFYTRERGVRLVTDWLQSLLVVITN